MKFKVPYKILAVIMAFVVFVSTLSFTINAHFCGENLVNTSFISKTKPCCLIAKSDSDSQQITSKCCSDKQLVVEGQNELKLDFFNLDLDQQQFVTAFLYSYSILFESVSEQKTTYKVDNLPFFKQDFQALYQSYLI